MNWLLAIFITGTAVAAFVWLWLLIDSRRILRAQKPQGMGRLIAMSGLVLDCLGLVLVGFNLMISVAAHTHWRPGDAAFLFSLSPFVLALYGLVKLWYRRRMFAALDQNIHAAVSERTAR